MKLKKILCMAVVSVAVALTGIPQGATTLVHAEETQIAGLDEILRQMYGLYQSGDYSSMYDLDANDATKAYVESVKSSGSDRYVIDLDENTKAMMYVSSNGGYWWYFGEMENNLRQGIGTTIVCSSNVTRIFTGNYNADFPSGEGKLSNLFNEGSTFDISGIFQGTHLNGVYQVNASWFYEGFPRTGSVSITYRNNHLYYVNGWHFETFWTDEGYPMCAFNDYDDDYVGVGADNFNDNVLDIEIVLEKGIEPFAIVWDYDCDYYWWMPFDTEELNRGLFIFEGNGTPSATAVATQSAPAEPAVTPNAPAEPTEPAVTPNIPAPTPNTYVVERGDNLSKIAKKVYGDAKCWRIIYEANKNVIKSDYTIWANQVLVIPAR